MKRKAPYEINKDQIDNAEEEGDKPDLGKVSTPVNPIVKIFNKFKSFFAEIKQRKILKTKGPKQAAPPASENINFTLNQNLQKVEVEQTEAKEISFINKNNTAASTENKSNIFNNSASQQQQQNKDIKSGNAVEISDSEKTKLSENISKIGDGSQKPVFSGLFNNGPKEEKKEEPKQTGNLFASAASQPATGLFANAAAAKPAEQKTPGGLFANVAPSNSGLFANAAPKSTSGGLFGNTATSTSSNIFNNAPSSGGLFGNFNNENKPAGGLFAQQPQQGGLQIGTVNKAGGEDEDEEGDEDAQVSGQNTPEIDKEKAKKFEYGDIMEKLSEKNINKFKKNTGDVQEKGIVSIERLKGKEDAQAIIVYRNNLKQILYQGNLVKKLSTFRNLNNKDENLLVQAIVQETVDGKPKFTKDSLKIQFQTGEDGNSFKTALESIL